MSFFKEETSWRVKTRKDWVCLMEELEKEGEWRWFAGQEPTEFENWEKYGSSTYINLEYDKIILYGSEPEYKLKRNSTLNTLTKKSMKLSSMIKRLLDQDSQTLYKAEFINGDLKLTEEGKNALMVLIFDDYRSKLVAEAKEKIEEEKKSGKD